MPSNKSKQAVQKIDDIANIVADSVDLDVLMAIAKKSPELVAPFEKETNKQTLKTTTQAKLRVGICEDPAFGFYYESDKQAFHDLGVVRAVDRLTH